MHRQFTLALVALLGATTFTPADPPVASYVFPAGGQRGKNVAIRVGGLFLHQRCAFEMLGPGVEASKELRHTKTTWFEGPLLPLPDSQQAEDYPKDLAGRVTIAADAALGMRFWRLATSQGATPAMKFVIGDLPEIVEEEIEGTKPPVRVTLPVTINGRIFPREDVDGWAFHANKGQHVSAEVCAARLGSPLDSRIEVIDAHGRRIAENDDHFGADSYLGFTAPEDGVYQVRIHDANFRGGQAYVYRLTLTADPWVTRVFPLGGRRGGKTRFELAGQGMASAASEVQLLGDASEGTLQRFSIDGKLTNPVWIDLSDLPEYLECEPNDQPSLAKSVEAPAVLNGRIDKPGDVDCWAVSLRKGGSYDFDLRAARLGSPLSGVLSISDSAGKVLARADGATSGNGDPALHFGPPVDGVYLVRIAERFSKRGGPEFAYRLYVDRPAAPDYRLQLTTDALAVSRGAEAKLRVSLHRVGGFAAPVELSVDGLPPGVTVGSALIAANQNAAEITFKADAKSTIRSARLTIRGSAKIGTQTVAHVAAMPAAPGPLLDSVLLAVALPTPFKVVGVYDMRWAARGTVHKRRYKLERGGFDGPVEISLADRQMRHLQGITGPTIVVPPGASEFVYPITLPPWMETGRTARACVMAVGVVKDADGSEHVVSFHSVQQNEQVVAVVEPGKLSLATEPTSILAAPGKQVSVAVRVARSKGLRGDVKIELVAPAHVRGVVAEAVTVAADEDRGTLTIRFDDKARGPFTMPLVLRGTLTDKGEPVIAEAKIEVTQLRKE